MHPYLQTLTLPHQLSCEGCWRSLYLDPGELSFADRHTAHGIEKLVSQSGWTAQADGTAWCPKCSGLGAPDRFFDDSVLDEKR